MQPSDIAYQNNPARNSWLMRTVTLLVVALVVGTLGTYLLLSSYAGTGSTTLYLAPATGSYQTNTNISVAVRINSGTDSINVVSIDLSYSGLQYLNMSTSGSPYTIDTPGSNSAGHLSFSRGTISPTSGDQLVATLTFQASSAGNGVITMNNSSAAYRSTDNSNAAGVFNGASYAITAPAPAPTPPASPTTPSTPASSPTPPTTKTGTGTTSSTPKSGSSKSTTTSGSSSGTSSTTQTSTTSDQTTTAGSTSAPAASTSDHSATIVKPPHSTLAKTASPKTNNVALVTTVSTASLLIVGVVAWRLFFPGWPGNLLRKDAVASGQAAASADTLDKIVTPAIPNPGELIKPQDSDTPSVPPPSDTPDDSDTHTV